MDVRFDQPELIAGSFSTLLFISAHIPMLAKAIKSRDMRSYSMSNIVLNNVGNLLYWFYILTLPPGPIWLLHTFYTVTTLIMLVWYLRYGRTWRTA